MPSALLGPDDPPPFEIVNEDADHPIALVCEHAGKAIPKGLGSLGLDETALDDHIAWDIGAGRLTRLLAEHFGATAILQPYSRLVIDCNRPVDAPDSMPEISDGVVVPGNRSLTDTERQARIEGIFKPFHQIVDRVLDRKQHKAAFAIHSFTPIMDGFHRPWDIGFVFRHDAETSKALAEAVGADNTDLTIGMNQPYQIDDRSDWFVPQHAERRGLPHSLIEVRNDHLRSEQAISLWAARLARAMTAVMGPEEDALT